jgi:hypothetical protein
VIDLYAEFLSNRGDGGNNTYALNVQHMYITRENPEYV